MRLLCRYAGGLACLVTALALVACGGGPGSEPEPKQIENIKFSREDKARTISLSDKFNGSDLTYSATTSDRSVATVTVDNDADTLTVTVVGPGKATITVTAKNSRGEANQDFTVTVPTPPAPEPVEFPDIPSLDKDTSETIPLGGKFSGENLTYSASSSHDHVATVTVDKTANTLTVTAVGPGQAIITVTATAQGSTPQTKQTKTFTVTVPPPASVETAPTVKTGATTAENVDVEATVTVLLSTVFDGATSYTATSSASTIATAGGASSGTLTITGRSKGSATITIVATNDAGTATHQIAVTVTVPVTTPPTTTPTSSTLTIELGESAKRTLAAGQTLQSPTSGGVDVERSPDGETGNVWLITAKKKGTHTVIILSAGKAVGAITVEVPNSPPIRDAAEDHPTTFDLTSATDTVELTDIADYFTDADEGDSEFYRIENKPDWFLIETKDGFVLDNDDSTGALDVRYEVLQEVEADSASDHDFSVSIYAIDESGDESTRPVVLTFEVADDLPPREVSYTVQQKATGELKEEPGALKVGPRLGVDHTVTFDSDDDGFMFANSEATKLVRAELLPADHNAFSGAAVYYIDEDGTTQPSALPDAEDEGSDYYILKSSGALIASVAATTLVDDPLVTFELKKRSSGSITVEYHVWARSRKLRSGESPGDVSTIKKTFRKSLSVSVVTCNSPPDPIDDCP